MDEKLRVCQLLLLLHKTKHCAFRSEPLLAKLFLPADSIISTALSPQKRATRGDSARIEAGRNTRGTASRAFFPDQGEPGRKKASPPFKSDPLLARGPQKGPGVFLKRAGLLAGASN